MTWPPFVCMHEATHAVIAASQGLTVKRVTIEKNKGRMGFCEVAKPEGWIIGAMGSYVPPDMDDPDERWKVAAMMRVALGGLMTHTTHPIAADDRDLMYLTALLHEFDLLDESREQLWLERLVLQTHDLRERHAEAINAIAVELSWRKSMDCERLQTIMAENAPRPRSRSVRAAAVLERAEQRAWRSLYAELGTQATRFKMRPVRFIGEADGLWWFEKLGL